MYIFILQKYFQIFIRNQISLLNTLKFYIICLFFIDFTNYKKLIKKTYIIVQHWSRNGIRFGGHWNLSQKYIDFKFWKNILFLS